MIILGLLIACSGFTFENVPGHISWPSTSWVLSPISSTSWHASQTVTLTITFNPSTSLASGVVQLLFPSAFSTPTITIPITTSIVSKKDYSVSYSSFTLPSQGTYGPISILTRSSSAGSIIDSNILFCSIAVSSTIPVASANSLSVNFYDITTVYIGYVSSIYFNFNINLNLWKYDIFYLYLDPNFGMSTPSCESLNVLDQYNELNSSSPTSLNTLQCYYDSKNARVVVYGLATDVNVNQISSTGSITASLLINGFINPNAAYSSSTFKWNLYIGRFSQNTFIAAYTGSGPSTQPRTLSVLSWLPTNGYDPTMIVMGLTLYMDLKVQFFYSIPATGQISISFSGGVNVYDKSWRYLTDGSQLDVQGDNGYYLITPSITGSCTVMATSITCSGFTSSIPSGVYIFTTYTNFISTSPSVTQMYTYADTGSTVIESAVASPAYITYASSTVAEIATDFQFYFSTSKNTQSAYTFNTGPVAAYIVAQSSLPVTIASATTYYIYLPISTVSSEKTIKITSALTGKESKSASKVTDMTAVTTSVSGLTLTTGCISYTTQLITSYYDSVIFYVDNGSGSASTINFPSIGSNLYTRYEVMLKVIYNGILYVYSRALSFLPDNPASTFSLMCIDSGIAGIPATVTFTPRFSYSAVSSAVLYIQITITGGSLSNDFDSGLNTGDPYPYYSSFSGSLYGSFATSSTLLWTGFSSLSGGSSISITFPMGKMISLSTYAATIIVYYNDLVRTDIKNQIISTKSTSVQSIVNTLDTWSSQSITSGTSYATSTSIPSLTLSLTTSTAGTSGYLGLFLPQGSTVASATITKTSLLSGVFAFTSSNINYKTPGVFGALSSSNSLGSSTSFTFTGITTPRYFNPSSPTVSVMPLQASSTSNAACISFLGTYPTLTLSASPLSTPTFTPSTVTGGGPTSLSAQVSITFTNAHAIPSTGKIVVSLASGWGIGATSSMTVQVSNVDITSLVTISLGTITSITNLASIPSLSTILINIYNAIPPSNPGTSPVVQGHLASISTYATTDSTQNIDKWVDSSSNSITVTPSLAQGNVTITSLQIYPNSTSSSSYLSITMQFDHSLPIGSTISTSSYTGGFILSGDISNYCFFTLQYSSCSISGNLVITLAQAYTAGTVVRLQIDTCISVTSAGTSNNGITITTSYGGYTIDTNTYSTSKIVIGPAGTAISASLVIYPLTAGELAEYTFQISSSISSVSLLQIVFPAEFDYVLGRSYIKYKSTNPNIYYLDCYSSLGVIECPVMHRVVNITVPSTTSGTSSFAITGITNPLYKSTYSNIKIYAFSSSYTLLGLNENIAVSGITPKSNSLISIRSISLTDANLQDQSDYTFQFILSINMNVGDQFVIEFPEMYQIQRDNPGYLSCNVTYVNTAANLKNIVTLNGTNLCYSLGNNQINYTISQYMAWNSSVMVYWNIYGITNPEWGYTMTVPLDSSVYAIYDVWTTQFNIKALSSSSYTSSSYNGLNAAYIGLSTNTYTFLVNSYTPRSSTNIITLIPGTQSQDLYITTSAFQSTVALIKPENYQYLNTLTFSSALSFEIYNGQTSVAFRVSVPIGSSFDLQYINWVLTEVPLSGNSPKYTAPVKTPVEIYSGTLSVSLGNISPIAIGSSSLPITVTLTNSPESSLIISISPNSSNIVITPSSLTFTPGVNALYYQITVSSSYGGKAGDTIMLSYSLSGTDSAAYTISSSVFTIGSSSSSTVAINSISLSNIDQISMTATVVTNIPAQVCWELGQASSTFLSYAALLNSTASLIGSNSQLTFEGQIQAYLAGVDKAPLTGESWNSYQRRLYKNFIQKIWTGCVYTGSTTVTIFNINWLWAQTDYKLVVYAINGNVTNATAYATTSSIGEAVDLNIGIAQSVDSSYLTTVQNGLAGSLGILPNQLTQVKVILTNTSSTIIEMIYPTRSTNVSPFQSYQNYYQATFKSVLSSIGIIAVPVISYTTRFRSSYATPTLRPLAIYSYSTSSVTIQTNSTATGEICCISETNLTGSLSTTQVLLGLTRNNSLTSYQCVANNASVSSLYLVYLNGLIPNTFYTISCTACNSYPIWPECGIILSTNLTTTTAANSQNTVASSSLLIYFEAFAALLIYF